MTKEEVLKIRANIVNKIMNLGLMMNGLYSEEKQNLDKELLELQKNCAHEDSENGICIYCGKKLKD